MVAQIVALLGRLDLQKVALVGNFFGGAISLHLARRHPERVSRLELMGAVSLPFELTDGLDKVWGYTPTIEKMRELMNVFAHDKKLINDDLIKLRFDASKQRGMGAVYESLFPAPRQRWIQMLAQDDDALRAIEQPTLLLHGRHDQVIPLSSSIWAADLIPNSDLMILACCGHWTQIERRDAFVHSVSAFLSGV